MGVYQAAIVKLPTGGTCGAVHDVLANVVYFSDGGRDVWRTSGTLTKRVRAFQTTLKNMAVEKYQLMQVDPAQPRLIDSSVITPNYEFSRPLVNMVSQLFMSASSFIIADNVQIVTSQIRLLVDDNVFPVSAAGAPVRLTAREIEAAKDTMAYKELRDQGLLGAGTLFDAMIDTAQEKGYTLNDFYEEYYDG